MSQTKRFLSTGQVARLCGVSIPTVHRWTQERRLAGFRLPGSKQVRVERAEVERFMEEHGIPRAEKHIRLLVVDDEQVVRDVLSRAFDDPKRFQVRVAANGFEAGVEAASFKPDVILLDIALPDLDGRSVAGLIRKTPGLSSAVIIAISGAISDREAEMLPELGFDAYFRKPFPLDEIRRKVAELTVGR